MTTTPSRAIVTVLAGVAYVGAVVAANWASTHCPAAHLGSLIGPAGTVWAGFTFTLRDPSSTTPSPRVVWSARSWWGPVCPGCWRPRGSPLRARLRSRYLLADLVTLFDVAHVPGERRDVPDARQAA